MTAQEEPNRFDDLNDNVFARIAMKNTPGTIQGIWQMVYAGITALLAIALEIKRMRQYHEYKDGVDFNIELWKASK